MHLRHLVMFCALWAAPAALAQEVNDVQFAPGNFGTMIEGAVTGTAYVDYRLGAQSGQEMFIDLQVTGSDGFGTAYFNLLPPGSDNVAIYNGSMEGTTATVDLPEDGTYTVRVYLMGNDRDTGATVDYRIDLSIQ